MARFARLVVPGYPHHVTQRGVRSMTIFDDDRDRFVYLRYMAEEAERFDVRFLVWCLMENHVHLIAVPAREDSLARAIGEAHRRYTWFKNSKAGVRGYLFQGRFHSCVLDQPHLLAAGRYIELNPVKARMLKKPQDYMWSSCRYHSGIVDSDPLIHKPVLPELVDDWIHFLDDNGDREAEDRFFKGTRTGRPVGDENFVRKLELATGRILRPKKAGRPRKVKK